MKIVAIVQARIGSDRLAGKVLMDISGKPMLWHVIHRLKQSKRCNEVAIATSDDSVDIVKWARDNSLNCVIGDENDVLARYFKAAGVMQADVIVRITGDCPLIDPRVIDSVIERHISSGADYTSNTIKRTYPRGLDTEVFNYGVLKRTFNEAKELPHREHVTAYIYQHPEIFKLESVEAEGRLCRPDIRICVDTKEDLDLIRRIFGELADKKDDFFLEDIIDLFNSKPQLKDVNRMVQQKTA